MPLDELSRTLGVQVRVKLVVDISVWWSVILSLGAFFRQSWLEEKLMNALILLYETVFLGATLLPVPGLAIAPSTQR